jgi:hypothetical protein
MLEAYHIVNIMSEEKQIILKKIDELIDKRKADLLKCLPSIHEIDDGIIIRFFSEWDNCDTNELIRFKKIVDADRPEDITIFYFLPKGAIVVLKKRDYIHCVACLSGKLELDIEGKKTVLTGFKKICFDTDEFQGIALEDTYVITSNKK